jgi:hypothetical protein
VNGGVTPYSYLWSNSQWTYTASGLCAGTHTLTVTDANGCIATGTVTITQTAVFYDSTASTGTSCGSCCDGSATVYPVGGSGPYLYQWYPNGASTATATGLCAGTYTAVVTDMNGCSASASVTINNGNSCTAAFYAYPDSQNTAIMWVVNMASGAQPITYTWNWGDNSPDDYTPYPTHTYTSSGQYYICFSIADNLGCSSATCNSYFVSRMMETPGAAPTTVYVIPPPTVTSGAGNEHVLSNVSIYPNPAHAYSAVTFSLSAGAPVNVTIYDLPGNKVVDLGNREFSAGNHYAELNTGALTPGIYFVKIMVNGHAETKRLVVLNN